MESAIFKSGGNASLASMEIEEGRVSIVRWNPKGLRRSSGPESMGAIPTMNRSAKGEARSSLHYGGEGVLIHSPHQGVCRRHGTEDSCVTPGGLFRFSSGIEISDPISDREMGSDAERVVGQLHSTSSVTKVVRLSVSRAEAIGSSE